MIADLIKAVPRMDVSQLPAAEQSPASRISSGLYELASIVGNFRADLSLSLELQRAGENRPGDGEVHSWLLIPYRDGIINIYNFSECIRLVKQQFQYCPSLRDRIDQRKLREVEGRFRERFPNFEHIRHSVAHAPELANPKGKKPPHAIEGPYEDDAISISAEYALILGGSIVNGKYSCSWGGKMLSYELNDCSLLNLQAYTLQFYEAFSSVNAERT